MSTIIMEFNTHHDSDNFFLNVNTIMLSAELPPKIIPYFIKEWK
jgi:hypothetical protein